MPYLKIITNQTSLENNKLLKESSELVSDLLGKPETYVMIDLRHNPDMLFAGSSEPLAYLELKSLGLDPEQNQTGKLSESLCKLIMNHLEIEANRIYIEFSAPERKMWGWDGRTF